MKQVKRLLWSGALGCTALLSSEAALVGHWKLDETSGASVRDASGASIDGTVHGSIAWGAGKDGGSAVFPGSAGNYIEFDSEQLDLTGSMTVSVWAKYNGATNYGIFAGIDSSGGSSNDQYVLKTASSSDGRVLFQVTGPGGAAINLYTSETFEALSQASADGWVHFVGVYEAGASVRLYVNGSIVDERSSGVPAALQSKIDVSPFKIGAMTSTSTSYYLNGALDDVQLYDHALDATEVVSLYNQPGSTVTDDEPVSVGPVAVWNFDEGQGTTATDEMGALVAGLQGNAVWTDDFSGGHALLVQSDDTSQALVGDAAQLDITGAVTVAAWVQPAGPSQYGVIAGIDQSGGATNDQYVLKTNASATSQLSFQATGAGGSAVTATDSMSITERAAASTDGWIHVAGVFIPGEAAVLYVDGVEVARKSTVLTELQSTLSETVPFRIGNMSLSNGYGFNGAIDELQVYDRALDAAAVAMLSEREDATGGNDAELLFTFGAVADPQYKDAPAAGSRHYRNSISKLQVMVDDFNDRDLDFVVCLGDFIDAGFESYTPMMAIWKQLIHPAYHVVGNHDLSIGGYTLADVVEVMEIPSNYYSFEAHGWRFFVLDGNDAGYGVHSATQLSWLRDGLDGTLSADQPVIIFDHYPVYPPGTPHISPQANDLLNLLGDYPNVRVWMNGHNHSGAYGETNGIHFLNLEGMVETADTTAYAEIEVWSDRIEVKGEGREPSRSLFFPQTASAELPVPLGLSAEDSASGVRISWDLIEGAAASELELQRRASGADSGYTTLATLVTTVTEYVDAEVASGVEYTYRLRSLDAEDAFSEWSEMVSIIVEFLPGEIVNLIATGGDQNQISLTWDLDGASYDRLILERRAESGSEFYTVSSALTASLTEYTDTELAPNSTYLYRIAGVSGERQTNWSATASATTGVPDTLEGEAPGLIAYWPFDEGMGASAGDFSGNGLNGTLGGAVDWTAGYRGQAITFSGESAIRF